MKRVLTAVVLVPVVLLLVLRAPDWLFAIVAGTLATVAIREYLNLAAGFGYFPFRRATIALVVCLSCLLVVATLTRRSPSLVHVAGWWFMLVVVVAPYWFLVLAMARQDLRTTLPSAAFSALAIPYVFIPFLLLVLMRISERGWFAVLFILLTVWCGDIGAYYIGRSLGSHKLAPRISPNKSWEGAVASVCASIVVAILLTHYATLLWSALGNVGLLRPVDREAIVVPAPLGAAIFLAIAINVSAQLGDLAESMLKRGAGVKDSGTLLPGHGGVLDRIDALLFAAPVGVLLFLFAIRYFTPTFS
jgi:phosphatidate cytidylyltransferase